MSQGIVSFHRVRKGKGRNRGRTKGDTMAAIAAHQGELDLRVGSDELAPDLHKGYCSASNGCNDCARRCPMNWHQHVPEAVVGLTDILLAHMSAEQFDAIYDPDKIELQADEQGRQTLTFTDALHNCGLEQLETSRGRGQSPLPLQEVFVR